MKNTDNMMASLREDIDQRETLVRDHEQEVERRKQAVAEAESKMAAAIAANDEKAHHEAEGEISFCKARLAATAAVNPWWTPEEASELVKTMFEECHYERREVLLEAQRMLYAAMDRLREANRLAAVGDQYQRRVTARVPLSHSWGFGRELAEEQALKRLIATLENRHGMQPLRE